jgi:4-hydroxy-tetrahydrodipicolinate synthase
VPGLGTILTAVVTPFDDDLRVDEEAFVAVLHHLAAHGSDGVVVAGTTGEASTLAGRRAPGPDRARRPRAAAGMTVVAGAGSNDTRHAVEMTRRVCELGADAVLSVTPYYNRPNRRGLVRHYEEISRASDRPIVLYNIPQRTGTDMPNDLLAELAQLEHVDAVKQANGANLALVDGLELYTGNDEDFARTLDLGGVGGILVASHIVGPEMRRMVDEPGERAAIHQRLLPVFAALSVGPLAMTTKARLELLGLRGGRLRLPYVEADESEVATIREMLRARGLVEAPA